MKIVQLETAEHGADLEDLIIAQHVEIGGDRVLDIDECRRTMARIATDATRGEMNCWLAYDDNDKLVGYLGGYSAAVFYSRMRHVHCDELYIIPEARGSRALIMLVREFEKWGWNRPHVELLQMNVSHRLATVETEQVLHLYERLGYKLTGYYATKMKRK